MESIDFDICLAKDEIKLEFGELCNKLLKE
jgi:hypothetical protein